MLKEIQTARLRHLQHIDIDTTRDVPVNHPVLGICRVSHYPVLLGPSKIFDPSKFNFFQSKILNRLVQSRPVNAPLSGDMTCIVGVGYGQVKSCLGLVLGLI